MLCTWLEASIGRLNHTLRLIEASSNVRQRLLKHTTTVSMFSAKKNFVQLYETKGYIPCQRAIHSTTALAKKKAKKEKGSKKSNRNFDEFEPEDKPESVDELVDLDELRGVFTANLSDMQQEFSTQLALRTSQGSFANLPLQLDDGTVVNLQYLAQVSVKSPTMVHVNLASNPQYLPKVRDALQNSAFKVNPRIEGTSIFIETPRVTREHRERLSKSAKKLGDDHKVQIRNIQNARLKTLKAAEKMFSKDAVKKHQDAILQLTKSFNKQIDDSVKKKQQELLNDS